jgi:pimeloyl-ACP methyl ester carboxylesterase
MHGMELLRGLDLRTDLARITAPTLVCVGDLDPVTPIDAAQEIAARLPPGIGRLEVIEGVGHFPWLDDAGRYWPMIAAFVEEVGAGGTS